MKHLNKFSVLKIASGIVCLLLCTILPAQEPIQSEWIATQRAILASLTGENTIVDDRKITSRWTAEERALSRQFLQEVFRNTSMELTEQPYRMPNLHAFQDLILGPFRGANLFGILPATEASNEYVILGAHYDTERKAPGANDNASAIAVIYGVTKALQKLDRRDKNFLIVFFDQEEEENVGSRAFINYLKQQPWIISSVHTIDQMGWDKDQDRAIEIELPDEQLIPYYEAAGKAMTIHIHHTRVNASDHQAFRKAGYVVTGITEEFANGDTSPYKDTPADTMETIDFGYLKSTTDLLTQVFKDLLQAP
ncbi:MAG: M28 family peptidase [Bacteroidota bacterium]